MPRNTSSRAPRLLTRTKLDGQTHNREQSKFRQLLSQLADCEREASENGARDASDLYSASEWAAVEQPYAMVLKCSLAIFHEDTVRATEKDVLHRAWHGGVYPVVGLYRQAINKCKKTSSTAIPTDFSSSSSSAAAAANWNEEDLQGMQHTIKQCFSSFLRKSISLFANIDRLLAQNTASKRVYASVKAKEYLGDLHRYLWLHSAGSEKEQAQAWRKALELYRGGCMLDRHSGKLYHVISVLYRPKSLLLSFYYDCRSVNVNQPFLASRESMLACLKMAEQQLRKLTGIKSGCFIQDKRPRVRSRNTENTTVSWVEAYLSHAENDQKRDLLWQLVCLHLHSMLFTKIGLDQLDQWMSLAYLPILKVQIECVASVKFGTRLAILDLTALHMYSKPALEESRSAYFSAECLCSIRIIIATLRVCASCIVDMTRMPSAEESKGMNFALSYMAAILQFVAHPVPAVASESECTSNFGSTVCHALCQALNESPALISMLARSFNRLILLYKPDVLACDTGKQSRCYSLPEDPALHGNRWVQPFTTPQTPHGYTLAAENSAVKRLMRVLDIAKQSSASGILAQLRINDGIFDEGSCTADMSDEGICNDIDQLQLSEANSKRQGQRAGGRLQESPLSSKLVPGCKLMFDTNCYLKDLALVSRAMDAGWCVVLPLAVLQELQGLTTGPVHKRAPAAKAIELIETAFSHRQKAGVGRALLDIHTSSGARVFSLGIVSEVFGSSKTMDDAIIDTTCSVNRNMRGERQYTRYESPFVMLVTDDRNMRIKAAMVCPREIPIVSMKQVEGLIEVSS